MTDSEDTSLPGPEPNARLPFLGLPLSYGGLPHVGIGAPKLTDDSLKGIYHATTQVPSRAVRALNAVSTRIGAPALSGGAATAIKQTYAGPPSVKAVQRRIPVGVTRLMGLVTVNARLAGSKLMGLVSLNGPNIR